MLFGWRRPPPLPDDLLLGVATSDHQCEAVVPSNPDVRDLWELGQRLTPRGRATDFANRYPEDVQLARRLGCGMFRLSIAWARVEPAPGRFDRDALAGYRAIVEAIRAAGLEPLVTLHHFTWPVHLEERGGMTGRDFPNAFVAYATAAAEALGDRVRYWITFNEPGQLVYGYIKPWWEESYRLPPGLSAAATIEEQVEALERLVRNLFRAHARARAAIKRLRPDARVGANPSLLGLPCWLQRLIDHVATRIDRPEDLLVQGLRLSQRPFPESGDADATIAMLTATHYRGEQVQFSDLYFVAGQALLVAATSPYEHAADLVGRTVLVVSGSTAERDAAEHMLQGRLPAVTVRAVDDYAAALSALDAGQADALLADDSILAGLMRLGGGERRLLPERLSREPYAVALPHGDRALLDAVNAAVLDFKRSGAWAAAYARHLGGPPPDPPGLMPVAARPARAASPPAAARAGGALARIRARGHLIVAVRDDVPGFAYRSAPGQEPVGFEVDLARQLAAHLLGDPERLRLRTVAVRERIPTLRSLLGRFDRVLVPLLRQYSALLSFVNSNWWHRGMAGGLPEFLCPPECVGQQDFVGFDYYWGLPTWRLLEAGRLLDAAAGHFDRAPVWPPGLSDHLRYHAGLFPGQEIVVAENGSVDRADGVDRSTYLRQHLQELQRAVGEGVPVRAYLCWAITSNREWGFPFGPATDFGLYHVDLDGDPELKRSPTPAASTFREILERRDAWPGDSAPLQPPDQRP